MLQDEVAHRVAVLIYETALLESGFTLNNAKTFAEQIHSLMKLVLDVDPNAQVEEEEDEVDLKDDDSELNNFELEGTGENDNVSYIFS